MREYLILVGNLLENQKKELINLSEKIIFIEREINRLGYVRGSDDNLNIAISNSLSNLNSKINYGHFQKNILNFYNKETLFYAAIPITKTLNISSLKETINITLHELDLLSIKILIITKK